MVERTATMVGMMVMAMAMVSMDMRMITVHHLIIVAPTWMRQLGPTLKFLMRRRAKTYT